MLLLIDNYDSFTYNLWHYFGEMGVTVGIARNDALTMAGHHGAAPGKPSSISPSPCESGQGGRCLGDQPAAAGRSIFRRLPWKASQSHRPDR